MAFSQTIASRVHADEGNYDEARYLLELAEQTFSIAEVKDGLYLLWSVRASLELLREELALATVLIGDAIAGYRLRGDKAFLASALETQAALLARSGDPGRGAELLGEADHLREMSGLAIPPIDAPAIAATHRLIDAELGTMAFKVRWEYGRQQSMRTAWREVAPPNLLDLLSQAGE